jgi:hypothetical protein
MDGDVLAPGAALAEAAIEAAPTGAQPAAGANEAGGGTLVASVRSALQLSARLESIVEKGLRSRCLARLRWAPPMKATVTASISAG